MFKNVSIKTLLLTNFTFIILFLIIVGSLGLFGIKQSNSSLKTVYEDRIIPESDLGEIRILMMMNRLQLNRALAFRNAEAATFALNKIQKNTAEIDRLWAKYMATYLTDEESQLAAKYTAAHDTYTSGVLQQSLAAIQAQNYDELTRILLGPLPPLYQPVEEALDQLSKLQLDVSRKEFELSQRNYVLIFTATLILAFLSLLFAILASRHLLTRIVGPISRATKMVTEIAHGKLDTNIVIDNKDEIGVLLDAFKPMLASLKTLISEMNHMAFEHDKGDIDVVIDTSKFDGDFKK